MLNFRGIWRDTDQELALFRKSDSPVKNQDISEILPFRREDFLVLTMYNNNSELVLLFQK